MLYAGGDHRMTPETKPTIQRAHFAIALIILVLGGLFIFRAPTGQSVPLRQSLLRFEDQLGDWRGDPPRMLDAKVLEVLRLNDYVDRVYRNARGEWMSLYVGYFEDQKSGQMIHSPKNCLPGAGWNFEHTSTVTFEIESAYPTIRLTALRGVLVNRQERMLSYYWFQSRGRFLASEYTEKFFLIADAFRYNRTDGALIRVLAPLGEGDDIEAVDAQMRAFISKFVPVLQYEYFPEPVG
jgi:EpsI family protein